MAVRRPALAEALDAHRAGQLAQAETLYQDIIRGEASAPKTLTPQPSRPASPSARAPSTLPSASLSSSDATLPPDEQTSALHWLGVIRLQQQRPADARDFFEQALARCPGHDAARLNLGYALSQTGALAAAQAAFDTATRAPDTEIAVAAHLALAQSFAATGQHDDALHHFDAILAKAPDHAAAHDGRGSSLGALVRYTEAEQAHRTALTLRPKHPGTHNNLGLAVKQQGRLDDAMWHFRDALRLDPDCVPALINLGQSVALTGDFDQATAPLTRAVALAPGAAAAHHELANALSGLGRYETAATHYAHALQIAPNLALSWQNLGAMRFETGDNDGARVAFDTALRLNPALALARFSRASLQLAQGHYLDAWPDYEARHDVWPSHRTFEQPRWMGDRDTSHGAAAGSAGFFSLAGRRILIHTEQGYGDTLQFFRFVAAVTARAAHVIVEVQATLVPLLAPMASRWGVTIQARGTPLPAFDCHCPLLSLPLALGVDRADSTLGAVPPYLFPPSCDDGRGDTAVSTPVVKQGPARWASRLAERFKRGKRHAGPFRVGLAWSGRKIAPMTAMEYPAAYAAAAMAAADKRNTPRDNIHDDRPPHEDDLDLPPVFDKRAIPLSALEPLFSLPGIEWHIVQTEIDRNDRETLEEWKTRYPIILDGAQFVHFGDTAECLATLDHVVSVDTSVAHLAGALALPLSVMLPFAPDWRWHARNTDGSSTWYPGATLFQQHSAGDWDEVVQAIAQHVRDAADAPAARRTKVARPVARPAANAVVNPVVNPMANAAANSALSPAANALEKSVTKPAEKPAKKSAAGRAAGRAKKAAEKAARKTRR